MYGILICMYRFLCMNINHTHMYATVQVCYFLAPINLNQKFPTPKKRYVERFLHVTFRYVGISFQCMYGHINLLICMRVYIYIC